MHFPQKISLDEKVRQISTPNVEVLAEFQTNKYRQYTQLQSGFLNSDFIEANLGSVQIFNEKLSAGARIEAAPAACFVPFAAVLSDVGDYRFCGRERAENTLLQASGGAWDISFKDRLNYVGTIFDRQQFKHDVECLTGRPIPQHWFVSRASRTSPEGLSNYLQGVASMLRMLQLQPHILGDTGAQKMLAAQVLRLTLGALNPASRFTDTVKPFGQRHKGVRRVIDFLHVFAAELPTIPQLCVVAGLSERSLEYGFREYLDVTPVRYLRIVRLNGVRRDLLAAASRGNKTKVSDVALRWGFVEFGRFAAEYRKLFIELPTDTLRNHGI